MSTPPVRLLGPGDEGVLARVAPGVFDRPVRPELVAELLADPRHHLAVAEDGDEIVGFASGVHYVHPDKEPELWINEVGVAPGHRRRGLGRRLMGALMEHAAALGCREAWVLTERSNLPATELYRSMGFGEGPSDTVMFSIPLDRASADERGHD